MYWELGTKEKSIHYVLKSKSSSQNFYPIKENTACVLLDKMPNLLTNQGRKAVDVRGPPERIGT